MSSMPPRNPARELARRLRRLEPPELAPERQSLLARRAWEEALRRRGVGQKREIVVRGRTPLYGAAFALVLSLVGVWLGGGELPMPSPAMPPASIDDEETAAPTPQVDNSPLHAVETERLGQRVVLLGADDRVTYLEGTALDVSGDATWRSCSLRDGAALFDIAPTRTGRLEVELPGVRVLVTGTIFMVWARGDISQVRVYEGSVQVTAGGVSRTLGAGEVFASQPGAPELAEPSLSALHEQAERAVRARAPNEEAIADPAPTARDSSATGRRTTAPRSPDDASAHPVSSARAAPDEPREVDDERQLELARTQLAQAAYAEALALAASRLERSPNDPRWLMLRGDAQRALAQPAAAAESYARAAEASTGAKRAQAGYLAAHLLIDELGRAEAGLRVLEQSKADAATSALAERALSLRVEALEKLGRRHAARLAIAIYLQRFPDGPNAKRLRSRGD